MFLPFIPSGTPFCLKPANRRDDLPVLVVSILVMIIITGTGVPP